MNQSNAPSKFTLPFANTGSKNMIPVASQIGVTAGAASFTDGFPPLTMTPLAAGGIPPSGLDMNGILYMLSAMARWFSLGAGFPFDSTFATDSNIGGYPTGAIVLKASGLGYWLNTVNGNTSNPDSGGAGWIGLNSGALLNIQIFTSSGTYTPTPGTASIIVDVLGGGGSGGGTLATGNGQWAVGGGGGAGGYARGRFLLGNLSSVPVTVGFGAPALAGYSGNAGTSSSFGGFVSATGGSGGDLGTPATVAVLQGGRPGGVGVGGNIINSSGESGSFGMATGNYNFSSGRGGSSWLGGGGAGVVSISAGGNAGQAPGAGGGGAGAQFSAAALAGGFGANGIVIVYEYA
jgi:hypothetical protein